MKHPRPAELPVWLEPFLEQLDAYVAILATAGVEMGLIGPREVPRLWTRHILNCAVVVAPSEILVSDGARVVDVGSGAGLPGLVWAIIRPDLSIVLVEPLLRRATFLQQVVTELGLQERVSVLRGRGEDVTSDPSWVSADVVTARAVAPLVRLLGWTVPLLRPGGRLVALKGSSAPDEVEAAASQAASMGVRGLSVVSCGVGVVDPATTVVTGTRGAAQ